MTASDLNLLVEMGFPKDKAELAVKKTGSLQDAIDWLDKHSEQTTEEIKAAEGAASAEDEDSTPSGVKTEPLAGEEVAASLECKECGKKFRSNVEATFHATKSGHTDFEESTAVIAPLTEEEKAQKLIDLRKKLAAKRATQSEQDKLDQKRNEEIRRKSTKEGQDIKENLQHKERIKEAADKRAEKKADAEARKRTLEKIEEDKRERKRKADMEKAARDGKTVALEEPKPVPVAAPRASTATEARLRLNTPKGMLTKTFPAETTLFQVAQFVGEEQGGWEPTEFQLTFPKKSFTAVDMGLTVKEAGWLPSAAVIVK
jgi:hypothetical protein